MSIYSKKSLPELQRLAGSENSYVRLKAKEELALRAKDTKGDEEKMDDERLRRKGIQVEAQKDPCWKGYKQLGTKEKDGKKVPNCIPEMAAIKVVSILTGSTDTAKIQRFLESYKLDLASYDSFHVTENFKKFSA